MRLKYRLRSLIKIIESQWTISYSQVIKMTRRCSVTLLKLNKVLHTGIVPRSFVTNYPFLTTNKKGNGWVWNMTDRPSHCQFIYRQVIANQLNFNTSLGGLVPIFYNCSDHVYWQYTSSFQFSDILCDRDQLVWSKFA